MTRRTLISRLTLLWAALAFGGVLAAADTAPVPSAPMSSTMVQAWMLEAERDEAILVAQARISASQAKSIALREVPGGEVVDISRQGNVYRVRVVARSGRVVDVRVDARTGRVVG